MEQLKQMRSELKKLQKVQRTKNVYSLPINIHHLEWTAADSPSHAYPYQGALDLIYGQKEGFNEQRDRIPALAPLDGKVVCVKDDSETHGQDNSFAKHANFIEIKHRNREFSKIIHLAQGSALVKEGDKVECGQIIAEYGRSGYMFGLHAHWEVKIYNPNEQYGFKTLRPKIQYEDFWKRFLFYLQQRSNKGDRL